LTDAAMPPSRSSALLFHLRSGIRILDLSVGEDEGGAMTKILPGILIGLAIAAASLGCSDDRPPGCYVCDLGLFDCTYVEGGMPTRTSVAAIGRQESYGCDGSIQAGTDMTLIQIHCDSTQICFDEGADGHWGCGPVALGVTMFSWANSEDTWTCVAR
jgi:hypothetical protein